MADLLPDMKLQPLNNVRHNTITRKDGLICIINEHEKAKVVKISLPPTFHV